MAVLVGKATKSTQDARILEAFQLNVLPELDEPDGRARLDAVLHSKTFSSKPGGNVDDRVWQPPSGPEPPLPDSAPPGRGVFQLSVETARQFAADRIVLIGEAAHVLPPIGAQGLNLGLRDAATIAELVVEASRADADVGGDDLTARYDRQRRADVTSRTLAVDFLNRTLVSNFLPLHGLRGLGLYFIERIAPLRRALMREGVAPLASEPRLMRGQTL